MKSIFLIIAMGMLTVNANAESKMQCKKGTTLFSCAAVKGATVEGFCWKKGKLTEKKISKICLKKSKGEKNKAKKQKTKK